MSSNSQRAPKVPLTAFAQGLLWMGLSMISFIGMSVGSRELAGTLSIQQVLFFRALVGFFVILAFGRALLAGLRTFLAMLHVCMLATLGAAGFTQFGTDAADVFCFLTAEAHKLRRSIAECSAFHIQLNAPGHHLHMFFLQTGTGAVVARRGTA